MQLVDEQIRELEKLDVEQTKRPDFDAFWEEAMEMVRTVPLNVRGGATDHPFPGVQVRDLTVEGIDGTPVHTWFLLPPEARVKKVPVVICYHGASGSRSVPSAFAGWLLMGAAVIAHDFRMQRGMTGSNTGFVGARSPQWFTLNILDRDNYYFYHCWTDCLRMVQLALESSEIDPERIAVNGGSQGGAASLAVAALHDQVSLCMADVPSNCWMEKRIFDRAGGAANLATFLQDNPDKMDEVCNTLSYYDNINLADRIQCPTLVSLGLKDPVCPPANVYAAYNKIQSEKRICPYAFGEHGGGGEYHSEFKFQYFRENFLEE